jgi:hypothetical protein
MMAMMLVMLAGMPECTDFRAYDCNNRSAQIEQYSLLNPEPCGNIEKVHAIERDLGAAGAGHQLHGEPDGQVNLSQVPELFGSRAVSRPNRDGASSLLGSCQGGTV